MVRKRNKSDDDLTSVEARRKSEILRARRAVSSAAEAGKLPAVTETEVAQVSTDDTASDPSSSTPFAQAVRNMVVGLFGSGDAPETQTETKSGPKEQPVLKSRRSFRVSADPLGELARRHISQAGVGPVGVRNAEEHHCREVLGEMARARIQSLLADYKPDQLARLAEIPSVDGA